MLRAGDLALVPMTVAFMRALIEQRRGDAEQELGASIPADWSLPRFVLEMRSAQLEADGALAPWLLQAVVRTGDHQLVGNVGFHGPPGHHPFKDAYPGAVELGYTIAPAFQRRGYATDACAALIAWGGGHGAGHVVLSIAPSNVPSQRVAEKLGFTYVHDYEHEDRGTERIYVLRTE